MMPPKGDRETGPSMEYILDCERLEVYQLAVKRAAPTFEITNISPVVSSHLWEINSVDPRFPFMQSVTGTN